MDACLILQDGSVFRGNAFGWQGSTAKRQRRANIFADHSATRLGIRHNLIGAWSFRAPDIGAFSLQAQGRFGNHQSGAAKRAHASSIFRKRCLCLPGNIQESKMQATSGGDFHQSCLP